MVAVEIENNHNVYILGAGFSREAGLPLISDFLIQMRDAQDWLLGVGRKDEAKEIDRVFSFRLEAASAAYWVNLDLENIEDLFSLASASQEPDDWIRDAIAVTLEYAKQKTSLEPFLITVTKNSRVFFPGTGAAQPRPVWAKPHDRTADVEMFRVDPYAYYLARLLGLFAGPSQQGRNTFITFNYDTVLEETLGILGQQFCYGMGESAYLHPSAKCSVDEEAKIQILKLHGSMNWAVSNTSGEERFSVFGEYSDLLKEERPVSPVLIPPTWNKVFAPHLRLVWKSAVIALGSATRIIVIGFSMPPADLHFKHLLAAGLQKNVSLRKILFVDPDARKKIAPRARKVLRNAYLDSGAIEFDDTNLSSFVKSGRMEKLGRFGEKGVTVGLIPLGG